MSTVPTSGVPVEVSVPTPVVLMLTSRVDWYWVEPLAFACPAQRCARSMPRRVGIDQLNESTTTRPPDSRVVLVAGLDNHRAIGDRDRPPSQATCG